MLKQIQKTLKDILSSYKLRGFLGFLKHALSRIIAEWQVKKLSSKNHYIENSEMNDDMVKSMLTRWERSGFLLEPAQLEIYKTITKSVKKMDVCDIGCGSGLGSLILSQEAESVVSVGKIEKCTELLTDDYHSKRLVPPSPNLGLKKDFDEFLSS